MLQRGRYWVGLVSLVLRPLSRARGSYCRESLRYRCLSNNSDVYAVIPYHCSGQTLLIADCLLLP